MSVVTDFRSGAKVKEFYKIRSKYVTFYEYVYFKF